MKKLFLVIDEKEVEVIAQKIKGRVWFHLDGTTYEYLPTNEQTQNGPSGGAQDPDQIVSPMPGKIIKIFAKEGQAVAAGKTVIAMEAMKMEYNLKSQEPRIVKRINCKEGDQVGLGDLLVVLEEDNG